MVKLLGSVCILAGGGLAWWGQRTERRRRRDTLRDLLSALRRMQEEIRMARTPLPLLLETLAADCREEAAELFRNTAKAARLGVEMTEVWQKGVEKLPMTSGDREILLGLRLYGDEESVCNGISLATYELKKSAEELERRRSEEEKRATALWFSGAALLVILLI